MLERFSLKKPTETVDYSGLITQIASKYGVDPDNLTIASHDDLFVFTATGKQSEVVHWEPGVENENIQWAFFGSWSAWNIFIEDYSQEFREKHSWKNVLARLNSLLALNSLPIIFVFSKGKNGEITEEPLVFAIVRMKQSFDKILKGTRIGIRNEELRVLPITKDGDSWRISLGESATADLIAKQQGISSLMGRNMIVLDEESMRNARSNTEPKISTPQDEIDGSLNSHRFISPRELLKRVSRRWAQQRQGQQ